jgi:hypothetical protein
LLRRAGISLQFGRHGSFSLLTALFSQPDA